MYCSSCGVAVAQNLSYCNYCGAKLGGANDDELTSVPYVKPGLLVSAMVGLFILGIPAITLLVGMLKAVGRFGDGIVLAVTLFSFLILLSIEGVLLRLLFGGKRGKKAVDPERLKEQTTRELVETQQRTLPGPGPSVTEHTTRAFDPVYRERKETK